MFLTDIERGQLRLVGGYWKQDFVSEMQKILLRKSTINERQNIEKIFVSFLKNKNIKIFENLTVMLKLLKKSFKFNNDEIFGYWHLELYKAIENLLFFHYEAIFARYICAQHIYGEGSKQKEKLSVFQEMWKEFVCQRYNASKDQESEYNQLLELINLAVNMYKLDLEHEDERGVKRKFSEEH